MKIDCPMEGLFELELCSSDLANFLAKKEVLRLHLWLYCTLTHLYIVQAHSLESTRSIQHTAYSI
jgi:hypothetical protein